MDKTSPKSEAPISLSQTLTINCKKCGGRFEGQRWLIVDTVERPDLLVDVREGTLNAISCPHCGDGGRVDGPLLVYREHADLPVVFSPAEWTSGEEDRAQAISLVNQLRAV